MSQFSGRGRAANLKQMVVNKVDDLFKVPPFHDFAKKSPLML